MDQVTKIIVKDEVIALHSTRLIVGLILISVTVIKPFLFAYFTPYILIGGGIFLVVGLWVRVISLLLTIIMIGILYVSIRLSGVITAIVPLLLLVPLVTLSIKGK